MGISRDIVSTKYCYNCYQCWAIARYSASPLIANSGIAISKVRVNSGIAIAGTALSLFDSEQLPLYSAIFRYQFIYSTESVTTTSNHDFFGVISTPVDKSHEKSLKKRAKKIVEEWLDGELENSLGDATFMNDTRFVKLFIRYNTGMPSGAPVERMFSLGKDIMRAKRSRISDGLFNMLMFIKGNEKL